MGKMGEYGNRDFRDFRDFRESRDFRNLGIWDGGGRRSVGKGAGVQRRGGDMAGISGQG